MSGLTDAHRPLTGIRILAVEHFMAGPYGSLLLAQAGAEVIKVERPGAGELGRASTPAVTDDRGGRTNHTMLRLNRHKLSLGLDLQQDAGKDLFRRLVAVSDVIWDNQRHNTLERLGLGYEALRALKPDLIYVSINGFGGHRGGSPYADWPAYDIVAQAMAGLALRPGAAGDPPIYSNFSVGDQYPATLAAYGVMLALYDRAMTGQGRHVEIAMYDGAVALNELAISLYDMSGAIPPRGAPGFLSPFGAFRAADGYFGIAIGTNAQWRLLCRVMEREDLARPDLEDPNERERQLETVIRPAIEKWGAQRDKLTVARLLAENGIPAGPVQDVDDLFACPHLAARDMIVEVDDPVAGRRRVAGNPVKLSGLPPLPAVPPPQAGQHTDHLLGDLLGLAPADLAALRTGRVI